LNPAQFDPEQIEPALAADMVTLKRPPEGGTTNLTEGRNYKLIRSGCVNDSFWKDKHILVTGAGGFIGSHLTEMLLQAGALVRALVHYNSRDSWGHLEGAIDPFGEQCEVIAGDIVDPFAPRDWLVDQEYVFHLAALIGIPFSYESPGSYIDVNVRGTMNLLEAVREQSVKRFIHVSTSEVYGTAQRVPIDESHPLQAQSPYAASKIAGEKLAESYAKSFGQPVTVVRPFNTYGPRQSARAVIPTIIVQALTADRISLGSTEPVRDLTYVKDTCRGLLAVAACDDLIGETVNLGTGSGVQIGKLAETIVGLLEAEKEIVSDPDRVRPEESEVMRLIADASAARKFTGWQPEVSLEDGLCRTIDWVRDHLDEYKADRYVV
jgi:dTDP-glucose 4,6-dehydratase